MFFIIIIIIIKYHLLSAESRRLVGFQCWMGLISFRMIGDDDDFIQKNIRI